MSGKSFSTAPGVLIAVPQLQDPNFHRSVVVMVEHDAKGALGLVINHETPHNCDRVTDELEMDWAGPPERKLLRGGPVEPQSLWILHDDGWCFEETMRVANGVAVSRSREALARMLDAAEDKMQLLVGYAGWGAGQLEQEIADGAWITTEVGGNLIFQWPRDEVWARALRQMGIDPAHLVEGGGVQ